MGRKPGSKNAAKKAAPKKGAKAAATDNVVPMREAAPAMQPSAQSNGPNAAEKRKYLEEYRKHRRRLAEIMQGAADERGNGRSTLDAFKKKGGNPTMLKRMWELTDMSKGEAEAEIAEYLGYAVDIGINVVFDAAGQGGLADVLDPPPVKPTVEAEEALSRARAYSDGHNTAQAGGSADDNKFLAESAEHQQWRKGFDDQKWESENGTKVAAEIASELAGQAPAGNA